MTLIADNNGQERQHYGVTFAVLAVAAASYALLQSAVAPALPDIQKELHCSETATAWLLTGYLLSASVTTPIIGRLGDMFGKERTLVVTMSGLAIGTLLAALASSIGLLITARVIQGAGGAIFPLAFGIIRDEFPRERAAFGIALISAILGIGGGIGIVLAGPIISTFDYHWLFGALLLSGWLVLILLGITQSSEWGWGDTRVIALIAAGLILLVAWIRVEAARHEPLVDMAMMRVRSVWTVNAAAFLVGAGMYSSFILIPEFTETPASTGYGFGSSVTQAGLFLLPATVAMMLVSPVAGWLANRIGSRVILIAGCLATTASFTLLALAHTRHADIYVATALMGAGIGLAFSSLANLIVEAVDPHQTAVATGMNTVMRTLGGSVGGQVGASLIAGTVVASGLPTESGFTLAFSFAAGACLLAALASTIVPTRPRPYREAVIATD
jgi:MFS family permease